MITQNQYFSSNIIDIYIIIERFIIHSPILDSHLWVWYFCTINHLKSGRTAFEMLY